MYTTGLIDFKWVTFSLSLSLPHIYNDNFYKFALPLFSAQSDFLPTICLSHIFWTNNTTWGENENSSTRHIFIYFLKIADFFLVSAVQNRRFWQDFDKKIQIMRIIKSRFSKDDYHSDYSANARWIKFHQKWTYFAIFCF